MMLIYKLEDIADKYEEQQGELRESALPEKEPELRLARNIPNPKPHEVLVRLYVVQVRWCSFSLRVTPIIY